MPLVREVEFRAKLLKGNRIQIPKHIRLEFQIEPSQTLNVHVSLPDNWRVKQTFYAQTTKDGRLNIPKLNVELLHASVAGQTLIGEVMEVELSPTYSTLKDADED
jgi:hypothetical protein